MCVLNFVQARDLLGTLTGCEHQKKRWGQLAPVRATSIRQNYPEESHQFVDNSIRRLSHGYFISTPLAPWASMFLSTMDNLRLSIAVAQTSSVSHPCAHKRFSCEAMDNPKAS